MSATLPKMAMDSLDLDSVDSDSVDSRLECRPSNHPVRQHRLPLPPRLIASAPTPPSTPTNIKHRYNQFRRLLQLKPLPSIDDITTDAADRAALKSVYGNDIELVDLMPGLLAESHRPDW